MIARPRKIEYKPPDPQELMKAREKRYKEKKMWDVLREVRQESNRLIGPLRETQTME